MNRESDPERTALSIHTGDTDFPFVRLYRPLRNRQAEAESTSFARPALVHPVEPVENPPVLDKSGYFKVPDGPGLGITIQKEFFAST